MRTGKPPSGAGKQLLTRRYQDVDLSRGSLHLSRRRRMPPLCTPAAPLFHALPRGIHLAASPGCHTPAKCRRTFDSVLEGPVLAMGELFAWVGQQVQSNPLGHSKQPRLGKIHECGIINSQLFEYREVLTSFDQNCILPNTNSMNN